MCNKTFEIRNRNLLLTDVPSFNDFDKIILSIK